jgi:hypothetical protein
MPIASSRDRRIHIAVEAQVAILRRNHHTRSSRL